jgi:chromosomal replication initiator protein
MKQAAAAELWETTLVELKRHVSKANFEAWLKDSKGLAYEGGVFTVGVPTALGVEWLENRMGSLIRKALAAVLGSPVEVKYITTEAQPTSPRNRGVNDSGARLNPKYTFSSFVVGDNNRLAHAAALSVAEKPGDSYNPLFIYGGVGLGKTHLLHALGHLSSKRHFRIIYVSCEQFTNEFINAIREGRNEEFRRKYRGPDMLLIDDIHFIAGKEQTQEEFFHTFNDLHSEGRQLVISSDRHPKAMPLLEDRLRSRFEWGLIADIQPPSFETRLAILRNKAEQAGISIPSEVLEFLAQKVQSNIRELEGALNRLLAHARLNRTPLSIEAVSPVLKEYLHSEGRRSVNPQAVLEVVCKYYDLEPTLLAGKKRDRDIALPRQIAMYLLREETDSSLNEIGRILGGRDHSTVLHGWEKISGDINSDLALRREIMELKEILYARRYA